MSAAAVQKEHGVSQARPIASPSLGFISCGVVTSKSQAYHRDAVFPSRVSAQAAVFLLVALCSPAAVWWLFSLGPCVCSSLCGTLCLISPLAVAGRPSLYSFWVPLAPLSAVPNCSVGSTQLINQYPCCAFYRKVKVTGCHWTAGCCGQACMATKRSASMAIAV